MATDIIARGLAGSGLAAANLANARIDALPKGVVFKGVVDYYKDLPNNAELGDMYSVKYKGESGTTPNGAEYVWTEDSGVAQWVQITDSIDSELDLTSTNPVENKVIAEALLGKVDVLTTAPDSDNDSGRLGIVLLNAEPSDKYDGYVYIINQMTVESDSSLRPLPQDETDPPVLVVNSDINVDDGTMTF